MPALPQDRILVPHKELSAILMQGGVTLVLGAGVSVSLGIPNWERLAQKLWRSAFPKRLSPWDVPAGARSPRDFPQFFPIVFELVHRKIGDERFMNRMRKYLYETARAPETDANFRQSDETLAVIARLISRDFAAQGRRRLDSVITLNIDDLLERAIEHSELVSGPDLDVRAIGRSTHPPSPGRGDQPIPIYHIHGFLPSGRRQQYGQNYEHMLVFTDAQYWSSSGVALSFANRVMAWALSESRCVFIGLSMTDINLLRWLALRTNEFDLDKSEAEKRRKLSPDEERYAKESFVRHYWIRPESDDPSGFLSEFLHLRGIQGVKINSWGGDDFRKLIDSCFPADVAIT